MTSPPNILLILDTPALAEEIQGALIARQYTVEWVSSEEQALNAIISTEFDLLISTVQSAKVDGLRLLDIAKERNTTTPVILLVESHQIELALQGLDRGATGIQLAPYNMDLLERSLRQGLEQQAVLYEVFQLKRQLDTQHGLPNLIGPSHTMASLHDRVRQSATGTAPIILTGEAGTGKDHLARTLHNQSARSRRSFCKVAFSDHQHTTVERELFGYAPGIYPDDPKGHAGQIEYADAGTLYLDNLNSLSPLQRDQLLQCLETQRVRRLGDARDIPVDIRLIISITPPLHEDDLCHGFLKQLQQKFSALTIDVPPLRARPDDIPPLLNHFLDEHSRAQHKSLNGIEASVVDLFTRYPWPGNVRELYNAVGQMVTSTPPEQPLTYTAIPAQIRDHTTAASDTIAIPRNSTLQATERILIEETMKTCNHRKEECAKLLGIGLRTLYRKLKEYES